MFEAIVTNLLNKFLGDYVANLETDQLKIGIWHGDVKLHNLQLKREALDKFNLPIDVLEGYIGELVLKIPWSNLKGEPVRVLIKNIFVLAGPKKMSEYDPEEDDRRRQKRKQDKLETLEMLSTKPKAPDEDDAKQTSFTMQLITKIVDNLQVSIHNIHVRYEDNISNPDHMFAAGITLSELSAVSTDENWNVKFLDQAFENVHKLLKMGHLAVYFNSDTESLSGQTLQNFLQSFTDMISGEGVKPPGHSYILKPVSGTGRLILKKKFTPSTAKNTAMLLFDQLAFILNDRQYKDLLLLVSSFDYFIRQHRYRKFRPPNGITVKKNPKIWLQFALQCVLSEVQERRRKWTWAYFEERRDDRLRYLDLYRAVKLDTSKLAEKKELDALERKLSFQDIRFYRSLVEAKLRKEKAIQVQQQPAGAPAEGEAKSWVGSWFGSWSGGQNNASQPTLSEEQLQELYHTIDFDENQAVPDYDLPDECMLLQVNMQLNKGSFTVKQSRSSLPRSSRTRDSDNDPPRSTRNHSKYQRQHGVSPRSLLSINFDTFRFGFIKRLRSFTANLSLHSFNILDGTTEHSLYPYIISVQGDMPRRLVGTNPASTADLPGRPALDQADATSLITDPMSLHNASSSRLSTLTVPASLDGGPTNPDGTRDTATLGNGEANDTQEGDPPAEPFFQLTFENNPLDHRADSALTLQSRRLHFFFNPNAIETMVKFFRPPIPALDSMHNIIAAAGRSVEGFKQQTRAGLQFALEEHTTIDIQIDLDAPVIIIPTSFTDPRALVTVLDSGRLKVRSNLVGHDRLNEWRAKEGKELTDSELDELKSLMYDRFAIDLTSLQLVVGKSVHSCLEAIQDSAAVTDGDLHVLNRINLQFEVGISIIPQYMSLPKMVVEGHLPLVKLNFSDRKYRAIMKFVDMLDFLDRLDGDPSLSDGENAETSETTGTYATPGDGERIGGGQGFVPGGASNLLTPRILADRIRAGQALGIHGTASLTSQGYNLHDFQMADSESDTGDDLLAAVDDHLSSSDAGSENNDGDKFYDAETYEPADDGEAERVHSKQIVLNFTIGEMSASLRRSDRDIEVPETYLAELKISDFSLNFVKQPYNMTALVHLGDLEVEDRMHYGSYLLTSAIHPSTPRAHLEEDSDSGGSTSPAERPPLMRVEYQRVDPLSPEFASKYEGMRQSVDVRLSSVNVNVIRGSILTLHDFILKTFVPNDNQSPANPPLSSANDLSSNTSPQAIGAGFPDSQNPPAEPIPDPATVRVRVNLNSINLMLNNDEVQLATLSLSHADIAVLVRDRTMRVGAKLGNLTLTDDCAPSNPLTRPEFRHLLSMEGGDLANFSYETFDATTPAKYPGFDAALFLRVGSARLVVAEEPVRALMEFGSKFAQMHVLFDAARQAASEQAAQLQERANRFHFNINIKTPVLVFPESTQRPDTIVANLGEINFENRFVDMDEADDDDARSRETDDSEAGDMDTKKTKDKLGTHEKPSKKPLLSPGGKAAPSTGGRPAPPRVAVTSSVQRRLATVGPHYLPPLASGAMSPEGYNLNPDFVGTLLTAEAIAAPMMNKMFLQISSIRLASALHLGAQSRVQELPLIADLNLGVAINIVDHTVGSVRPEVEITAKLSDVHMKLTERQYQSLLNLGNILSRTFTASSDAAATTDALSHSLSQLSTSDLDSVGSVVGRRRRPGEESDNESRHSVDSFAFPDHHAFTSEAPSHPTTTASGPPPANSTAGTIQEGPTYTTLDLVFNLETIDLEIFHGDGTQCRRGLSEASFSRFCSENLVLKHMIKSNQVSESEVQVFSFAIQDTRPNSRSKFRDILPVADHSGPQLLARVDSRPGEDTILMATVDHPRVILDLNHMFAMKDYFLSAFNQPPSGSGSDSQSDQSSAGTGVSGSDPAQIPYKAPANVGLAIQSSAVQHNYSAHGQAASPRPKPAGARRPAAGRGGSASDPPAENTPATQFAFRINIVQPEVLLLADATNPGSEAVVLSMEQVVVAQQGIFALTMEKIEMSLCRMDRRADTSVSFIDPFDVVLSMHNGSTRADHMLTNIIVDIKPLVLRVSYEDISLLLEIANTATQLSEGSAAAPTATAGGTRSSPSEGVNESFQATSPGMLSPTSAHAAYEIGDAGPLSRTQSQSQSDSHAASSSSSSTNLGRPVVDTGALADPLPVKSTPTRLPAAVKKVTVSREIMKLAFQGAQVVLIGNKIDIPVVDVTFDAFSVNLTDWSTQIKIDVNLRMHANYYNLQSSHWEPLVEPWQFGVHLQTVSDPHNTTRIDIQAKHKLDINISHAFIETMLNSVSELTRDKDNYLYRTRVEHVPYQIKNQTGTDLYVWNELPNSHKNQTSVRLIKNQETLPWRFGNWHRSRDVVVAARNKIGLQFTQVQLESLKDIPVDRESSKLYRLRPKLDDISHRLAVDVRLLNNVKQVVLRSSLVFENRTLLPLEMVMVDHRGQFMSTPQVVPPGEDFPVPVLQCHIYAVKVRPVDQFHYSWSSTHIYWVDFLTKTPPTNVICPAEQRQTPDFVLQVHGRYKRKDVSSYQYPFMNVRLSAPIEIENLLPYDIIYTVVDKVINREWKSKLSRGAIAPVHVVRPGHLLLMALEVPGTPYKRSRFAVIDASSDQDMDVDDQISLIDNQRRELPLRLDRRPIPDTGGAHIVSIYAPYVMINQTGLAMLLKSKSLIKSASVVAGQSGEGIPGGDNPKPFMFSYDSYEPRNRCLIKFSGGDWSKPLSFDAVGSLTEVVIPSLGSTTASTIHVGISVEPGPGKFSRTKVVSFTPRYLLKNNLKQDLNFREVGTPRSTRLAAGQRAPLHFIHQIREKQLTINFPGLNNYWSAPFLIDEVGKLFVKLNTTRLERILVRVDVVLEGACIFILFSQVEGEWPYRIENASGVDVTLYQYDPSLREAAGAGADLSGTLVKKYRLPAGKTMSYSWDYPSMRDKQLVLNVKGHERHVDIQQIGTLIPFKFASSAAYPNTMSVDVIADHATQVLRLTSYNQNKSIFKPKLQRKDTLREAFEIVDVSNVTTMTFRLRLEGIGLSLINAKLQELMYTTFRGIEFKYTDSTCNQSLNWMIEWVQIDNQLYGGLNEILLYPTIIPKTGQDTEIRPTLHVALVRAKDESYGVNYIRYFSILLQEMSLEMDEDFLFALLEFAKFGAEKSDEQLKTEEDRLYCETVHRLPEPPVPQDEMQLYFEVLHIQPLKFNLSFVRTQRINQEMDPTNSQNPLMVIGNAITMAIGNVNDAPVKLNALVIENVRASMTILLDRFTKHYGQEALYQIHKVLGSADVIGNPVGLFNNISSGVADFFYEPYHGFVMSDRPQDFGIGLARGTYSLFSKTVYGFSDSFSKFAESVSKGLSVATLDKSYQDRRRISRTRNRPRHALYGVSQGATSFASSVASGITGVVMQPIQGAEKEGLGGFFKGVGKGLVGVVTKPMVGVFDLASHVTEGIKNTTTVFNAVDLDRVRLPRFVARDGILHPYNQRDALGQFWLKQIDNGDYFYETYLAHLELRGSEMVALVTYSKLMLIKSRSLSVEWVISLSALQSINLEATGISLTLRGNEPGPFIPIPEASSRRWLYRKLEEAVRELTQRKNDD
ncbi:Vacuolar protein sorting-associated protein 13 [Dimargaris cristalligena]|nr:Vacuolar protein sorting-associated protein 13 [Dimargaris cristalligena]